MYWSTPGVTSMCCLSTVTWVIVCQHMLLVLCHSFAKLTFSNSLLRQWLFFEWSRRLSEAVPSSDLGDSLRLFLRVITAALWCCSFEWPRRLSEKSPKHEASSLEWYTWHTYNKTSVNGDNRLTYGMALQIHFTSSTLARTTSHPCGTSVTPHFFVALPLIHRGTSVTQHSDSLSTLTLRFSCLLHV